MIVQVFIAINGDANEEIILLQKGCPLIVNKRTVCLNGIADRYVLRFQLVNLFREVLKEGKSGNGGFSTLECKVDVAIGIDIGKSFFLQ